MLGDSADMLRRLKSLIPSGWFDDVAPMRDIVLGGVGDALAWVRGQGLVVRSGTRRAGTAGWLLDLDAWGFFGAGYLRRPKEADDGWRTRYSREIFRPRVTRAAIKLALTDLTGKTPELYEPWNVGDCGAYDVGTLAYAGGGQALELVSGYDVGPAGYDGPALAYLTPTAHTGSSDGAGCYGSYELPFEIFVRAYRGAPAFGDVEGCGAYDTPGFAYGGGVDGVPQFAGVDTPVAGYDLGTLAYLVPSPPYGAFAGAGFLGGPGSESSVSDAEMYATVARTKAAGITAWVELLTGMPPITVIVTPPTILRLPLTTTDGGLLTTTDGRQIVTSTTSLVA